MDFDLASSPWEIREPGEIEARISCPTVNWLPRRIVWIPIFPFLAQQISFTASREFLQVVDILQPAFNRN